MTFYKKISVDNYRYKLPEDRIAKYPLEKRDESNLLIYKGGDIKDEKFYNLGKYLDASQTLVFNNTRVIRSRLIFSKDTGARIEIFCLEPNKPASYEMSLKSTEKSEWQCLVGNLRKWKDGQLRMKLNTHGKQTLLIAEKSGYAGDKILVTFSWDNSDLSFGELLEITGRVPVPPYLNRKDEEIDKQRYQTIYSLSEGSVAAPTAGLHFSDRVMESVEKLGLKKQYVTLHVGAGTFVPVKSETIGGHTMHKEHFSVSLECLESLLKTNVIAVGTTSVRTLESLYALGNKITKGYKPPDDSVEINQWDPYEYTDNISTEESLKALISYLQKNKMEQLSASTSAIIVPGYRFKIVKGLISNFHMPASTLLLLVSAMIGDNWRKVYNHALAGDYRFLSYGDSSLLLP